MSTFMHAAKSRTAPTAVTPKKVLSDDYILIYHAGALSQQNSIVRSLESGQLEPLWVTTESLVWQEETSGSRRLECPRGYEMLKVPARPEPPRAAAACHLGVKTWFGEICRYHWRKDAGLRDGKLRPSGQQAVIFS